MAFRLARGAALVALLAALGVVAFAPTSAGAYPDLRCQSGECARASADGKRIIFATGDRLVASDDTESTDVYELVNGRTLRLLTADPPGEGPQQWSEVKGISRDGRRAIIETQHRYSPLDTDGEQDIYLLEDDTWRLVSLGPNGFWAPFLGVTSDARHIYFSSDAGLVPSDTDGHPDLYEWDNGVIRIVSTGPTEQTDPLGPNYGFDFPGFGGATEDGSEVYFLHDDALTAGSDPLASDLYRRVNASVTEWIPLPGSSAPWSPLNYVGAVSHDGSRLYFNTNIRLTPDDTDNSQDSYVRTAAGQFTLLSKGPTGGNGDGPECAGPIHLYLCTASYLGASRSGSRVILETDERLTSEDSDSNFDIYERSGGTTTLLTPGTVVEKRDLRPMFQAVSADGAQIAFTTWEQLVSTDDDTRLDIYVRSAGTTHLVSTGPTDRDQKYAPRFADFTEDGDNVVFWTRASLLATDTDAETDVYQRVDFNQAPGKASAAGKRKGKKRAGSRGRTRLVSAERIGPKMRIFGRGRVASGIAQVRIACPRKEESGACKGTAKALGAGEASFKLKRGRSAWVSVGPSMSIGSSAMILVRARDALGNRSKSKRSVRFQFGR